MSLRRTARRIGLVALFVCGVTAAWADNIEYANIHSVAVISAMGDTVAMNTWTNSSSDSYSFRTDWNVDAQIVSEVTQALSGHFVVKNLSADSEQLAKILSTTQTEDYNDVVKQFVRSLPKSNGVDAYVIVLPDDVNAGTTKVPWIEKGQFGARAPSSASSPDIRFGVLHSVNVYDATKGRLMDWGGERGSAVEQCAGEMWAEKEDALSAEQKNRIRQEIVSLLSRTVPLSLYRANLISDDAAQAAATQFAVPGDPSCHKVVFHPARKKAPPPVIPR